MRIPINDNEQGAVFNDGSKLRFVLLESDYYLFGIRNVRGYLKMSYKSYKALLYSIRERSIKIDSEGIYPWQDYPDVRPESYGRYQVMLSNRKTDKIIWNGTDWSYYNNQIVAWRRLK